MLVNGISTCLPVGGIPGRLCRISNRVIVAVGQSYDLHPINHAVVREAEDELINNLIDPNRPTDKLHGRICRVGKDEVVPVEVRQPFPPNAASHRRDVVDIGFLDHSAHGFLNRSFGELEAGMLLPDGFEVKVGSADDRL